MGEKLKTDLGTLLIAVRKDGRALGCVAHELASDPTFALNLVLASPLSLQHMPAEIQEDRSFALEVARVSGEALRHAFRWHGDREVMMAALQNSPQIVRCISDDLLNREFVFAAVDANPNVFSQLPFHYRCDLDLA